MLLTIVLLLDVEVMDTSKEEFDNGEFFLKWKIEDKFPISQYKIEMAANSSNFSLIANNSQFYALEKLEFGNFFVFKNYESN